MKWNEMNETIPIWQPNNKGLKARGGESIITGYSQSQLEITIPRTHPLIAFKY